MDLKSDLLEVLYNLDYNNRTIEEIQKIIFIANVHHFLHYNDTLFQNNNNIDKETDEKEINNLIENMKTPIDFTKITEKLKEEDKELWFISKTDKKSLTFSMKKIEEETTNVDILFKKYLPFKYKYTICFMKTAEEEDFKLFDVKVKQFQKSQEVCTRKLQEIIFINKFS